MNGAAPDLKKVRFSVCALGDTAYEKFCQTGKDFDARLGQPFRPLRVSRIRAQHALSARRQQARDRLPGTGQSDHEKRAFGQGRSRLQIVA